MLKHYKDQKSFSGMVGLSMERGLEIFAILNCSFLQVTHEEYESKGLSGKITDGDLLDRALERAMEKVDKENQAECFYLGFKFAELTDKIVTQNPFFMRKMKQYKYHKDIDIMIEEMMSNTKPE